MSNKTKHVWVTGGAGFIGSNFLHWSMERYPDSVFTNVDKLGYAANLESVASLANNKNYRFRHLDLVDLDATQRAFAEDKPDLVFHFAAESHVDRSIHGPLAFVHSNIVGTANILEACRTHWSKKEDGSLDGHFHHVSTDEVYGSLGPEGFFVETTAYDPSSPYSASKAGSDHLVRAYGRTFGLPFSVTNCSNNYGPRQFPEKLIPLMLLNMIENKPLPVYGNGHQVRDWLYVDDHCAAIWAVVERGQKHATYNVGGNNERRNIDVIHALAELLEKLSGKPKDASLSLIRYVQDRPGHDVRYAIDASKVRSECGFDPAETVSSGFEKTVRWYLENQTWIDRIRSGEYRDWMKTQYGGGA